MRRTFFVLVDRPTFADDSHGLGGHEGRSRWYSLHLFILINTSVSVQFGLLTGMSNLHQNEADRTATSSHSQTHKLPVFESIPRGVESIETC